jgi:limonene-1,2-epoxide hydrolase
VTTATATSLETVQAFVAAIARKDFDTALTYVAENCEYENIPMAKVTGPAAVRAVLEPFLAPTSENEFVVRRAVADGPVVFVERLDRHHIDTGWVELPVAGVFEVHDGKITVWNDYFDLGMLVNQWPALAG